MPVDKFRDPDDARKTLWVDSGDPSLAARIKDLWELSAGLHVRSRPTGVQRFSSIEEANRERESRSVRSASAESSGIEAQQESNSATVLPFRRPRRPVVSFEELESAFEFVSTLEEGINSALIDLTSGKFFWCSELDELDQWPDHVDESQLLEVPHKNELDLGRRLIDEFVDSRAREIKNEVYRIFRRRGAYRRFRDLLDSRGLLNAWNAYECERTAQALTGWCDENGLDLSPPPDQGSRD